MYAEDKGTGIKMSQLCSLNKSGVVSNDLLTGTRSASRVHVAIITLLYLPTLLHVPVGDQEITLEWVH